ncbi:pyruvate, phosphate dikinase [Candidatus Peregrinibacteria bacterium CG10_big_fil_rev_8_21_14_0_10_36_19]|nr:MAG: pyruvate, phosphate dikinase [Candidatus Peregrinibacteria bacterium CG10_big_fil_rev_8_21_14_0_10_36_19]
MFSNSTVKKSGKKYIYSFDEGDKSMKDLLGGKGANLSEMTKIGIPVPFGFTISTELCRYFLDNKGYPDSFAEQLEDNLSLLEIRMGKKFGDTKNPLLVSVRSGAAASMPGMMDTILNLGLNDDTVTGLIEKTGNERFAYDSYRRFVQMFGNVVMDVDHEHFEDVLEKMKENKGVSLDTELDANDLKRLVTEYKLVVKEHAKEDFPESPYHQLKLAIEAVFNSWDNERAIVYRRLNNITGLKGTAVNVQSMVFGNMGDDSGTGVAFTRNPSTGAKEFYGEFLMNAQGEDVVAGIRTPVTISELEKVNKSVYDELVEAKNKLETHYKNMQDIEFTIEKGKLFLLQTRNGKRTAAAALKIAVDMVEEGLLTKQEALLQIDAKSLNQMLHPQIKKTATRTVVAKGLPASPGAACGKVVFTAEDAVEWVTERGETVILVRKETSPEDISGMHISQGILTSRGGMTSHAAVVCRGMGKCCVAGCNDIMVNAKEKKITIGDLVINEGDIITLDGGTGEVMMGEMEMQEPDLSGDFKAVMDWADEFRHLKVRTNADSPEDCRVAIDFGAEGIGLCRTEHMFFDEERIPLVRKMIMSKDATERAPYLEKLQEFQKKDFEGIFKVMGSRPVTVRLLDPPLHEFLPEDEAQIKQLAEEMGMPEKNLHAVIDNLHEINPMLGHRGCRLGITYPDIYEMQVRAIAEAAMHVSVGDIRVDVEIEIPLVGEVTELKYLRGVVSKVLDEYEGRINFDYKIGTMIEIPRACVTADEIAEAADFMSFGTNDLTQLTFGYSRDDIGKFMQIYLDKGILEQDPMGSIDEKGVGKLMDVCVKLARTTKKGIEIGICGEQGGDPQSVEFCHKIGLDYVSCSPYRVPIAKLAAAQAKLKSL